MWQTPSAAFSAFATTQPACNRAIIPGSAAEAARHPPAPTRTVRQPRTLIVAPTRELAVQIHRDAELLGRYAGLGMAVVYGGAGYETQRKRLEEGVDILIGTPGTRKTSSLSSCRVFR